MSVKDLAKKYLVTAEETAETLNFSVLNRKLTALSTIVNDLKKAAQAKESSLVIEELRNLGDIFKTTIEELKLK